MIQDKQKKVLKKVLIRPSTMVIVTGKKELYEIRKKISEVLNIATTDIEFTYNELDKK